MNLRSTAAEVWTAGSVQRLPSVVILMLGAEIRTTDFAAETARNDRTMIMDRHQL
jgi:hypothetical protein